MAHNPLTWLLQKAFADAVAKERQTAVSADASAYSRRQFLKDTAYVAGGVLLAPSFLDRPVPSMDPADSIAIIGAGIAGLQAAYCLKKQGIIASVYEASPRPGGRMFTMQDQFGENITTDIGGEFVDGAHTDILQLVKELGLELYDLRKDTLAPKTFWFEGRLLGEEDLRKAIQPYVQRLLQDIRSLPARIDHTTAPAFYSLDQLSILEYLSGIGISGWLLSFLDIVLTREYGMEAAEQSAINFLIMFEPPADNTLDYELFGNTHEIFKIRGGSQHLSDKLYEQVKDQVQLQQRLVAISTNSEKGYDLQLESQGQTATVQADQVIIAIPFTILRTIRLDLPMSPEKRKCIVEMGYGNSCKFIMGMEDKPWRKAGSQGYSFTDLSFGCGWDSSQLQSEDRGGFTVFGGGKMAEQVRNSREESLAEQFIPALDTIYQGAQKAYTGRNIKFCWATNPYSRAGYSSFKKGQWSTLAGWESAPVGKVWFAGEHTSREFQGYMNGAAQTGRMAAEAVAANIKNTGTHDERSTGILNSPAASHYPQTIIAHHE